MDMQFLEETKMLNYQSVGIQKLINEKRWGELSEFDKIQDKADNWGKIYGIKAQHDTMQEKIQNLQRRICQQKEQIPQRKDRGAR